MIILKYTPNIMRHETALKFAIGALVFILHITAAQSEEMIAPSRPFIAMQKMNVDELVKEVLNVNSNIPAMHSAWEASKTRLDQVGAFDDPTLAFVFAPQTIAQNNVDFGQSISISQRLPWPGKRRLRKDVARYESQESFEGITRVRLKLIEASRIAFSDWYYTHAALRINKINQSLLQEFHNIAEIKYVSGRTSKQDVLHAEVEVTQLEHRGIVLERKRRVAKSNINTLLQRQPDLPLPPPEFFSMHSSPVSIKKLRQHALSHHPDILASQAQIQANNSRIKLSQREFYPDVKLTAAYNSLWNQSEKRFTLGASVNIPLKSNRHAARDQFRAQNLQLDSSRKVVIASILNILQSAYENVEENQHILKLFEDRLLPLAEENLAAAQSEYESGNGNFLDLISAEKNLMRTQLNQEQARANSLRRWAILERASGGTIQAEIEPNKVQKTNSKGSRQ